MKAILAFVIVVAIVGGVSFAKMFGVRITLPAIKKFDAAFLVVLLAVCTVVAQKGTNDPPRGASAPCSEVAPGNGEDAIATSNGVSRCNDGVSPSRGGIGSAVTVEDVGRMFSVVSVGTNEVFDFMVPAGATRVQKWWLRGGSNDRAFVPKGVVKIGGELLDSLRNPTNRFYPLKATSLLVAGESEFWHQQTAANSTVYTWKDAYLWRNLSLPFSMQTEIFDDGDFEYRYDLSRISDMDALTNVVIGAKFGTNELGDVSWLLDGTNTVTSIRLHRLSEFDWDGDGLANDIDPDPYTSNGDCHGQGEGWVLASFTNSAEIAAAGGYTNWVASVVENDTDGWWYSFTITVDAFDATGHAVARIDDKAVVLDRENNSATFLLMRGRSYPFSVDPAAAEFSAASYDGVQPQVEYSFGTGLVSIMAGVEILPSSVTLHPISGYSTAYFEAREWNLNPALGVSSSWSSAHGRIEMAPAGDGVIVFWGGTTNELYDTLYYDTVVDGYTNRQSAVVRFDPDPEPLPHVALSSPNTIFVNDDDDNHNGTNDYLDAGCAFSSPDDDIVPVVVEFKSLAYVTNGTLRLSAQGLRILENQDRIGTPVQSLTMTNCVTPFERTLYVERDSLSHSQVDECRLALEWIECTDPALGCVTNCITAIKPEMRLVNNVMRSLSGTNYVVNPCSVVAGGRHALYEVNVEPSDYPANRITWSCNDSDLKIVDGNPGTSVCVKCPQISNGANMGVLSVRFGDCPSVSPACQVAKTPVRELTLSVYQCMRSPLPVCPISPQMLDELNDIYSQIGIRFSVVSRGAILDKKAFSVSSDNSPAAWMIEDYCSNDDGIRVFVADNVVGSNAFTDRLFGAVFVGYGFAVQTLAHEIGHYLGADDVYVSSHEIDDQLSLVAVTGNFDANDMSDIDWNNGSGQRFYKNGERLSDAIERLLMYGFYSDASLDIPHSEISGVGFSADGTSLELRKVKVGRMAMSENGGVL